MVNVDLRGGQVGGEAGGLDSVSPSNGTQRPAAWYKQGERS
jgi:hypothetical protein